MRARALSLILLAAFAGCSPSPPAIPTSEGALSLTAFRLKEPVGHRVVNELVHFDFDVAAASPELRLTDASGAEVPTQIVGLQRQESRLRGAVWTVVSLEPGGEIELQLRSGRAAAAPGAAVRKQPGQLLLTNGTIAVALPRLPGVLAESADLATIAPPLRSVRRVDGEWLGEARWVNEGDPLRVVEASTSILESGPVRASVKQRITFAGGKFYEAVVTLGAKQDTALVTESSDVDAPRAALRLSVEPGLGADHVVWPNHGVPEEGLAPWALADTRVPVDKPGVVIGMRPWSFWWLPRVAEWAGFYRDAGGPYLGVALLRPSRWSPHGWGGFERTQIPVTARGRAGIDLSFSLASGPAPLHREWALTAGAATDQLRGQSGATRLRRVLIEHSELPLDELKDHGFGFVPHDAGRPHPYLILARADVERVRRQALTDPIVKARVASAIAYLDRCGGLDTTLKDEGWEAFYRRYVHHDLHETLPDAYLGSADPKYGALLAAAVKGRAREVVELFLDAPTRPAIGSHGPWVSEVLTRLVLDHDLIAGSGLLTPAEEAWVRRVMVLGAHVLAHPDYWNLSRGLASANPNMTSSILLPLGLLGLALQGHPEAPGWVRGAEAELAREIEEWVSPGGAWIENPSYQVASLDGMFLLAQGIRNVTGRDHFNDPKLRATMDYFGSLLTPPDRRFPPKKAAGAPSPMVLPSIGDAFSGMATPFNGWMAAATARSDPAYSARQQFFWRGQTTFLANSGRAKGLAMAITDAALPSAPPEETSRAFPGFGSVMRSSWTSPEASYVAHRTGPNAHHYHHDQGSFVYYAKGAPLCLDPGNNYHPSARTQSWEHNLVSFDKADSPRHFANRGKLVELRSLARSLDYSHGETAGYGGQRSSRHLLLVKSDRALGANYVVIRDTTPDDVRGQTFYWNLWCLSREPEIAGNVAHFPGQMGVDLDVHLLSPAAPRIEKDRFAWQYTVPVWGDFSEEQHAVRVIKDSAREDFFAVLYPRTAAEKPPRVTLLAGGAGVRLRHDEGTDWLLHAPGKGGVVDEGDVRLRGEIVLARRYSGGALRLAVLGGRDASARLGAWGLASSGPVAIEVTGRTAAGESSGEAHPAVVTLPNGFGEALVTLDGATVAAKREGRALTIELPAGRHRFEIAPTR